MCLVWGMLTPYAEMGICLQAPYSQDQRPCVWMDMEGFSRGGGSRCRRPWSVGTPRSLEQ